MKKKVVGFWFIVLSVIMIAFSVSTLALQSSEPVGDWAEVCCGTRCGGANYCEGAGGFPCCFG